MARRKRAASSAGCRRWRDRRRSTNQSIVFCRESRSRWAGTETTIRLPSQRASDVFLRRALIRTSTSGTLGVLGMSAVFTVPAVSEAGGEGESIRFGASGVIVSVGAKSETSNKVMDGIVVDECDSFVNPD